MFIITQLLRHYLEEKKLLHKAVSQNREQNWWNKYNFWMCAGKHTCECLQNLPVSRPGLWSQYYPHSTDLEGDLHLQQMRERPRLLVVYDPSRPGELRNFSYHSQTFLSVKSLSRPQPRETEEADHGWSGSGLEVGKCQVAHAPADKSRLIKQASTSHQLALQQNHASPKPQHMRWYKQECEH